MEGEEGAALCLWESENNFHWLVLSFHLLETGSVWFLFHSTPDKLLWEQSGDVSVSSAHLALEVLGLQCSLMLSCI